MRKKATLLLVLIFLTASCTIADRPFSGAEATENSWVTKAPMHEARSGLGVAVVNQKLYAIGGTNDANKTEMGATIGFVGGFLAFNEEYDPYLDKWAFKKSMPTPRYDFAITAYQNKIYCIGGKIGIDYNAGKYILSGVNEVYDPATDSWEVKAPMPTPRTSLEANAVNGKIYLIGGQTGNSLTGVSLARVNEVYDPATDSWTTKAAMPIESRDYASATIGSKIYILGGFSGSIFHCTLNQIYDTVSDSWKQGAPLPFSALHASAGVTTGKRAPQCIYVFSISGYSGRGTPMSNTQVYDWKNNKWSEAATITTSRLKLDVAILNDAFYAIGGDTFYQFESSPVSINEQYFPVGYETTATSDETQFDNKAPDISVISPKNETICKKELELIFSINEAVSWIGYRLDNDEIVEIEGNLSLSGLVDGAHEVAVYATDAGANTGASDTIYFTADSIPPKITLLSPSNQLYNSTEIPLNFIVSEGTSQISYSLDGLENLTIIGNVTLSGLPVGEHRVTVYAWDVAGNSGVSETVSFTVAQPETFPVVPVATASFVLVAFAGGIGLLFYFKKRKH